MTKARKNSRKKSSTKAPRSTTAPRYFSANTFGFIRALKRNNTREWFAENKSRYEEVVKDPALRLIEDFAPELDKISRHFLATPRSLFRIYRDTRFSNDKSPYKTHIGIQFRHAKGKDVHAPGFYLHIEPGNCFGGLGLWHPDGKALRAIRQAIVAHPERWSRAIGDARFTKRLELAGDALTRPPRGFDPEHPLIEDLKRKDFIAVAKLTQRAATSKDLVQKYAEICRAGKPMVKFLCEALRLPF